MSFLGWMTEVLHGQVHTRRVSLALVRDKAGRGAGMLRASHALEPSPLRLGPGGQSSPRSCLQRALD